MPVAFGGASFNLLPVNIAADFTEPLAVTTAEPGISIKLPKFTLNVTVPSDNSLGGGNIFTVGLIQQVDGYFRRSYYANGFQTTNFAAYPVNDSVTLDAVPWYTNDNASRQTVPVGMNGNVVLNMVDIPHWDVHWNAPLPPDGVMRGNEPTLRRVIIQMACTDWIVAQQVAGGAIQALGRVAWLVQCDVLAQHPQSTVRAAVARVTGIEAPTVAAVPAAVLAPPTANTSSRNFFDPYVAQWQLAG